MAGIGLGAGAVVVVKRTERARAPPPAAGSRLPGAVEVDARQRRTVGRVMDSPQQASVPGLRRVRTLVEPNPIREQVGRKTRRRGSYSWEARIDCRIACAGRHECSRHQADCGAPGVHDAAHDAASNQCSRGVAPCRRRCRRPGRPRPRRLQRRRHRHGRRSMPSPREREGSPPRSGARSRSSAAPAPAWRRSPACSRRGRPGAP